jgi:hypothetical protein
MSNDVPLLVQFDFEQGTLQFFLAPKVCFLLPLPLLPSFPPSLLLFFPSSLVRLPCSTSLPLVLDPELTPRSPTSRRRNLSHLSIQRGYMLLDCFQIGHLGRPRFLGNIMNQVSIVNLDVTWNLQMRILTSLQAVINDSSFRGCMSRVLGRDVGREARALSDFNSYFVHYKQELVIVISKHPNK